SSVAVGAHAVDRFTGHDAANVDLVDTRFDDFAHEIADRTIFELDAIGQFLAAFGDYLTLRIDDRRRKNAPGDPPPKLLFGDRLPFAVEAVSPSALLCATVVDRDDHILRHVYKTTSQIT